MSAAVEVFEVGQQQLWDMLRLGACVGDYVCVSTYGRFGWVNDYLICWVLENQDIDSLLASFGYLCERDVWALGEGFTLYAQEYEIWHVVDDAELWQMWEHDVAVSKRQRNEPTDWHVYHGGTCVLDVESVPTCLYRLRCVTANCEGVSDEWFDDEHNFADALGMCVSHGWMPWGSNVFALGDCVTIVDDDSLELDDYGDGTVLVVVCRESC